MSRYCTLFLALVSVIAFAQENSNSQKYDVVNDVDTPAEYPGGLTAFFAYLQDEIKYPDDANLKRIEGKVFVAFIVDKSGSIIPGSVMTLKSLYPSCDEEAERVMRACKVQWTPAMKDGTRVNQRFVLPVNFSLKPDASPTGSTYSPAYPIKTVVIAKSYHSRDTTSWTLYGDFNMNTKIGKVSVGDSVKVMGWGPWAYYIEGGTSGGYVSWKALKVTEELYPLSKMVGEKSEQLAKPNPSSKQPRRTVIKANAFFSLVANKKNISVGECVTVTMAFNIHPENRAPMQFYALGEQLNQLIPGLTQDQHNFVVNSGLDDIVGVTRTINNINYTTYDIYKASYCAMRPGTLSFPSLALQVAQVKGRADGSDSIVTFTSKPIVVKIDPIPPGLAPTANETPMVGKFQFSDSLLTEKITINKPVIYKITVSGEGLTFPIDAPEIKMPGVSVQLQNIVDDHNFEGDHLISKKSFIYQLVFQKPGVYDFKGKIIFRSFNPATKKIDILTSSSKVNVPDADTAKPITLLSTFGTKHHFIAVDVSQSMQIEDYTPY